jgi:hypothetical protein
MNQEVSLAVEEILLSQPAIQPNPGLTASLSADANALNAALNTNVAQSSPMTGMAFNLALMGLTAAQSHPVTT